MLTKIKAFFERLPIGFTAQALLYPAILAGALIFAQTYRTALSHTVFVFVLILPLGAIFQIGVAALCVRASVRLSQTTVEKKAVVSLFANVTNKGPLPVAFAEVELMLPGERISHSDASRAVMTLLPFSSGQIARGVEFLRRGEYEVGISHVYVYDFTRSVRFRVKVGKTQTVFVLPRRLSLPSRDAYAEGEGAHVSTPSHDKDCADAFDTRPYAAGDSLKRVHWKLSSKSEDIIVRDGAVPLGVDVLVMCDLEPYFGGAHEGLRTPLEENCEEIDNVCADAVVEMALAITLRELRAQNTVVLSWVEGGEAVSVRLDSLADYASAFRRLGSAGLDEAAGHIARIRDIAHVDGSRPIIVCPCLTAQRAREYRAYFGGNSSLGAPELHVFEDAELFLPDQPSPQNHIRELASAGFDVIKFKP